MRNTRRAQDVDFPINELHSQLAFFIDLHELLVRHFLAVVLIIQCPFAHGKILLKIRNIWRQSGHFISIPGDDYFIELFDKGKILPKILF